MLHHGDDNAVADLSLADVRLHAAQRPHDVQMKSQGRHKKIHPLQGVYVQLLPPLQVVVRRQDHQQRVVPQMGPLQADPLLSGGEAHVHPVLPNPAVHLLHAAHLNVHRHLRMGVPKALDDLRQPVHGNAGIGGHTNGLLPAGIDEADLPLQGLVRPEQILYHGKYPLPGGAEPDPRAAAHQQGKADVLFQAVHHVGQARLGVAQHLRRPGEAAGLHRCGQCFQFLGVHTPPS